MIKKGTSKSVIGGKPMASTYYKKIDRTRDLLRSATASTKSTFSLLTSNYYIAPSSVTFDDMVEEAIYELNLLVIKMEPPEKEDVITKSILANGQSVSARKNAIKANLERAEYTGVLSKVASELNASRLDAFSRAVLSEEGIFFYLAYRAIIGNEVTDKSGIATKILDALNLVKSYINVALVTKTIKSENLNVSEQEKNHVEKYFSDVEISYSTGEPEKEISDYIDRIKDSGSLYRLVLDFLMSDKVELKRGVDINALAQKMVDYLNNIGYVYQENDSENKASKKIAIEVEKESNEEPDDFDKGIKGIGPAYDKKLKALGVTRFYELAKYDNKGLKSLLDNEALDYTNIIKQAKLITESKFEELVKLQKKI